METSNQQDRSRDEWERLIQDIDSKMLSPEKRADKVKKILDPVIKLDVYNISNWDMICFCLWYLSREFMEYPFFVKIVKHLNKIIYQMHYQQPYEIGLLRYNDNSTTNKEEDS